MNKTTLIKKLKDMGYPLLEVEESINVNEILAEVVKSREPRLWEGFPLLLANSLERNLFNFNEAIENLKDYSDREYFRNLVVMSLAMYDFLKLKISFADRLFQSEFFSKDLFHEYLRYFKEKRDFHDAGLSLSAERLLNTFRNYYKYSEIDLTELVNMKDEFDLEFAMSQIFSKRQKELFLKKIGGERMTKTEREYYSRSVKKKVLALANSDLHRLAEKLVKK